MAKFKFIVVFLLMSVMQLAIAKSPARVVFEYDCAQFNDLKLGVNCKYSGPETLEFVFLDGADVKDEKVQYHVAKLFLEFASFGGDHFRIKNNSWGDGEYKLCSVMPDRLNYSCTYCHIGNSFCTR